MSWRTRASLFDEALQTGTLYDVVASGLWVMKILAVGSRTKTDATLMRTERSLGPVDIYSTKNCSYSPNSSLNCGCVLKMLLFVCEPMW